MKKTAIVAVVLGLVSPMVLSMTVQAEKVPVSKTTTGKIQFEVDDNEAGNIVKPNPDTEKPEDQEYIDITDGNSSTGPLRIQFVPNLDFGIKQGISAAKVQANAKAIDYKTSVTSPGVSTGDAVAPFVQVTDNRGLTDAQFATNGWELTVSATEFKAAAKDGNAEHVLTNSTINLKGSTLTTTLDDANVAKTLVDGQDKANGIIPTDVSKPLTVLKSKAVNTNGYQLSNVFSDNYEKAIAPEATVAGVEFVKPSGIAPQKSREYTSTLTWTLTDAL